MVEEEKGKSCGSVQTLFLKVGKRELTRTAVRVVNPKWAKAEMLNQLPAGHIQPAKGCLVHFLNFITLRTCIILLNLLTYIMTY